MSRKTILFLFNAGAIDLRSHLLQKFLKEAYIVKCALPLVAIEEWKRKLPGLEWVACEAFSGTSMGFLNNLKTLKGLYALIKQENPEAIFLGNVKPNIYGGLAARFLGIKHIYGLVSGLGYAFIEEPSFKRKLAKYVCMLLYKLSFKGFSKVFFQNRDDCEFFVNKKLIHSNKALVVPGTGVDLEIFQPKPLPERLTFFMAARLIKEKGVFHYVEAASQLKLKYPQVRFVLGGGADSNPSAITQDQLKACSRAVEYMGYCSNMAEQISASSVFVYPSYYREGVPRSLLEALSCGRPVITTNSVGCKETVFHQINGLKIDPRSTEALVQAMEYLIQNPQFLEPMGQESRRLAEKKFDIHAVNALIFDTVHHSL